MILLRTPKIIATTANRANRAIPANRWAQTPKLPGRGDLLAVGGGDHDSQRPWGNFGRR